jgi:uncharacterized repeat protein (TIGR01451 family)
LAKKAVLPTAGARKPGDIIKYHVLVDNDGSLATGDSTYVIDYLPAGVALADTADSILMGAGLACKMDVLYPGTGWLRHVPSRTTPAGMDSLFRVPAVRFVIPAGIAAQAGDNTTKLTADDSTGTDAGHIVYKVRIKYDSLNFMVKNDTTGMGKDTADAIGNISIHIRGAALARGTIPTDSIMKYDTVRVDSAYAFSSIDSIWTPASVTAKAKDSVYIKLKWQNYCNRMQPDSVNVYAWVKDTLAAAGSSFIPRDLRITGSGGVDSNTVQGADYAADTARYGRKLAFGAKDSMWVKVCIPAMDSAADGDSIKIIIRLRNRNGTGTNDSWPNTSATPVLDSSGTYLHVHQAAGTAKQDTLWDYGDTQYDTVKITIGGPLIRTGTKVTMVDGNRKPGDRLLYTMLYDNDGSSATPDTGFYVAYIPNGAVLLDTISTTAGNGMAIKTYTRYGGSWLNHIPSSATAMGADSLARVTALRFAVPPGVAAQAGDNVSNLMADDSTGTDAGMIKFRVKIR